MDLEIVRLANETNLLFPNDKSLPAKMKEISQLKNEIHLIKVNYRQKTKSTRTINSARESTRENNIKISQLPKTLTNRGNPVPRIAIKTSQDSLINPNKRHLLDDTTTSYSQRSKSNLRSNQASNFEQSLLSSNEKTSGRPSVNFPLTGRRASMGGLKSSLNTDRGAISSRQFDPGCLPRQIPHRLEESRKQSKINKSYVETQDRATIRPDHFSFKPVQYESEKVNRNENQELITEGRSNERIHTIEIRKPEIKMEEEEKYAWNEEIESDNESNTTTRVYLDKHSGFKRNFNEPPSPDTDLERALNLLDKDKTIESLENTRFKEDLRRSSERPAKMENNYQNNAMKGYEQRLLELENQNKSLMKQVKEIPFNTEMLAARLTERAGFGLDIQPTEDRPIESLSHRLTARTKSLGESRLEVKSL